MDVVFVCRSRGDDPLLSEVDLAHNLDELLTDAAAATCRQVQRFAQAGRLLGRGDVRVTMAAQVVKRLSWRVREEADAWLQEAVGVIERETTSIIELQRTWETGSATTRQSSRQLRYGAVSDATDHGNLNLPLA